MPQVVCLYRLHVWQMDNYLVPAIFELIRAHAVDFIWGMVRLWRLGSFFSNFLINFALSSFFICIKDFSNKAKCSSLHLVRLALILECKTFSFVFSDLSISWLYAAQKTVHHWNIVHQCHRLHQSLLHVKRHTKFTLDVMSTINIKGVGTGHVVGAQYSWSPPPTFRHIK